MNIVSRTAVTVFTVLLLSAFVQADEIDNYLGSWEYRALSIQGRIDGDAPLSDVLFLSTHNSYNSSVYTSAFSYWDPNHYYSIYEQLVMGVRELELDVHRYFSMKGWPWQWRTKLLLSHAQDNHTGASALDRELAEGLREISDWIRRPENSREILIIDIEDHMDGSYDLAVDIIQNYLGNLVYRPSGPMGLDTYITKNELLALGKRVIIISGGDNHARWRQWVFTGTGDRVHFPQGKPQDFRPYPDCGFSRETYDNYLVRYFEDRTNLSDWFSDPGDPITADTVREMVRCGVNIISMDKLEPFDGRLRAAVWSWDVNEPNNSGGEHCAEMWGNGRWNDAQCAVSRRFACKNSDSGEWRITGAAGPWNDGAAMCSAEGDGPWHFETPVNGYDNEKLNEARRAAGASSVWLNLTDEATEGQWVRGDMSSDQAGDNTDMEESLNEDTAEDEAGAGGTMNAPMSGCSQPAMASTGTVSMSSALANLLSLLGMTASRPRTGGANTQEKEAGLKPRMNTNERKDLPQRHRDTEIFVVIPANAEIHGID